MRIDAVREPRPIISRVAVSRSPLREALCDRVCFGADTTQAIVMSAPEVVPYLSGRFQPFAPTDWAPSANSQARTAFETGYRAHQNGRLKEALGYYDVAALQLRSIEDQVLGVLPTDPNLARVYFNAGLVTRHLRCINPQVYTHPKVPEEYFRRAATIWGACAIKTLSQTVLKALDRQSATAEVQDGISQAFEAARQGLRAAVFAGGSFGTDAPDARHALAWCEDFHQKLTQAYKPLLNKHYKTFGQDNAALTPFRQVYWNQCGNYCLAVGNQLEACGASLTPDMWYKWAKNAYRAVNHNLSLEQYSQKALTSGAIASLMRATLRLNQGKEELASDQFQRFKRLCPHPEIALAADPFSQAMVFDLRARLGDPERGKRFQEATEHLHQGVLGLQEPPTSSQLALYQAVHTRLAEEGSLAAGDREAWLTTGIDRLSTAARRFANDPPTHAQMQSVLAQLKALKSALQAPCPPMPGSFPEGC